MKLMELFRDQFGVKTPSLTQIAKKHKISEQDLHAELDRGIKVELEHTENHMLAREIALDHLAEDPKYYTKLQRIHKD